MEHSTTQPTLLVVAGPTASGKTIMCTRLEKELGFKQSVSVTTRIPRPDEIDGEHYHFVSEVEFRQKVQGGYFLEHASVHGTWYGTPWTEVTEPLSRGDCLILTLDIAGHAALRKFPDETIRRALVSIFIHPSKIEMIEERLRARPDHLSEENIQTRLKNAKEEMTHRDEFDHVIINDDLDQAYREMLDIVRNHRDTQLSK